jgi:hypothetical protein
MPSWSYEALEFANYLERGGLGHHGSNFDDFHMVARDAPVVGAVRLEVDNQEEFWVLSASLSHGGVQVTRLQGDESHSRQALPAVMLACVTAPLLTAPARRASVCG